MIPEEFFLGYFFFFGGGGGKSQVQGPESSPDRNLMTMDRVLAVELKL